MTDCYGDTILRDSFSTISNNPSWRNVFSVLHGQWCISRLKLFNWQLYCLQFCSFNPFTTDCRHFLYINVFVHLFHDLLISINNKETFLQDFLVFWSECFRITLKKCFFGTTWTVIFLEVSNLQPVVGSAGGGRLAELFEL